MKYAGISVNERLYVSGQLEKFEEAIKEKNINKVRAILEDMELKEKTILDILKYHGLIPPLS